MKTENSIRSQLDILAEFESQRDLIQIQKQELIDSVITPEIKQKLDEIDAEFESKIESVNHSISVLRDAIKKSVLKHGDKVKGDHFQAVYVKGRSSWDTKGLKGYAKAHPEILEFYKVGDPSVSIRKV